MSQLFENNFPLAASDGILTGKAFGYAANGGAVTQATNRTTGVTLSKVSGQITTNNASLAAEATAVFTVANTLVAATALLVKRAG